MNKKKKTEFLWMFIIKTNNRKKEEVKEKL